MYISFLYAPCYLMLQHGAIVLLYHPCVRDDSQLVTLKNLVRSSLDRHVISPYRRIPHHMVSFSVLSTKYTLVLYSGCLRSSIKTFCEPSGCGFEHRRGTCWVTIRLRIMSQTIQILWIKLIELEVGYKEALF